MGAPFFPILVLMLVLAGISIVFGYKLGSMPTAAMFEQVRKEAFEEAKGEYLRYFISRFDQRGLALANAYVRRLQFENDELIKQNKKLTEELEKERKKNESIGSN